ncbi:HNH endonuclease signature motif containing protein [Mycobacterium sp. TY815]|uniref:HNH endonuclease signature motif containing protein n=1 Tax=Mycobacterium sp. TY815 TaxID=3050581 RepID=UPI0027420A2B|nr:HNH endonuclease signature motif containing protein [Mycobacterium sp. TY815]MDP7702789.1 HNH endonuclease signature motif containing protein [Mycobacterium sp. TY815]
MRAITASAELVAAFDALDAAVASIADLQHQMLDPVVRCRALERLETSRRQQAVVSHDLIAGLATEDPADIGGPTHQVIADWCRISYAEARRRIRDATQLAPRTTLTGQRLPPELPATSQQWRRGLLDAQHLRVIQTFVRNLPTPTPATVIEHAEHLLAQQATQLRPDQLDKAAKRAAVLINPDGKFSDHDRARQRSLTFKPQRADGMSEATLIATPELRANIEAWLARFAAPGKCNPDNLSSDATPEIDTRTPGQRQHDALNDLLRRQLGDPGLGQHNGLPVTVVVTTTLQELTTATGHGVTASGTVIPMRELVEMASRAVHYLAIFDGHSNRPLYLGRARRIASADQRLALIAAERGCTFPGCDVPADKCEVHHINEWATGGNTDVDTLTLACAPNHKLIERGWTTTKFANHRTAWTPPKRFDRGGPRTNDYHHPERLLNDDDDERAGP